MISVQILHRGWATEESLKVSSPAYQHGCDLLWQRVDDETEEQSEDGQNDQGDDVFLELLPDEEDEGLHGIDEPVKTGGGTTRRTEKPGSYRRKNQ